MWNTSTLAFVTLVDGQARYSFFDENSAGRMLAPDDIQPLSEDVTALFFGGVSLICEPCAQAYADLAARAACDKVVMLDPNIRPGFIKNIPRYRLRLERLISLADIVKVSDEDLDWIYPAPGTMAAKVALLLKAGPSIVVLTRGAKGASAFTAAGSEVSVPSAPVQLVDTVGAGDTFNAGFLAKLFDLRLVTKVALRQIDINDVRAALTHGTIAAAITVSRAGANPPWMEELRTFPKGNSANCA